jgi:hypothetical protein
MPGELGGLDVAVDGAQVLDDVCAMLSWFVRFPSPEAADAATLFAAATHAAAQMQFAPRLRVKSPQKRCGKSRLLELLAELVHGPLKTVNISAAALVRSIDPDSPPTIVFDEADAVFGKGLKGDEKAENLRGILNAGFDRNQPYVRWDVTARQTENCPTFAMAIIAGIGDLPDTIEDRAVPLELTRKTKDETCLRTGPHGACPLVHKFRRRRDVPLIRPLRDRLAAWVIPRAAQIADAEPGMPGGLSDRAEDVWEALIAVADLAGGTWPQRARAAAVKLMAEAETGGAVMQLGIRLLADLRQVFTESGGADRIGTNDLLVRLCGIEDSPWRTLIHGKPLDANRLADLLRPFGIGSAQMWTPPNVNTRGYYEADLQDSWNRFLPIQDGGSPAQAGGAARGARPLGRRSEDFPPSGLAAEGARPLGPQPSDQGPSNLAGLAGTPASASQPEHPGNPGEHPGNPDGNAQSQNLDWNALWLMADHTAQIPEEDQ